jgi:hypothetical protein
MKKNKQRENHMLDVDLNHEESAKDFIKLSDIKASNPRIIEQVKRTESNLMEGIRVSENAFYASMRQASTHFKNDLALRSMH